MTFIRPEARAALWRWRDLITGIGSFGIGFYALTAAAPALKLLGAALLVAGCALIAVGLRRIRFPARGGGLGVVEVDERRITYYEPRGGGSVSIDALREVRIVTNGNGPLETDLYWIFRDENGSLIIPGDAEGTDALFDALSALQGIDNRLAAEAFLSTEPGSFVIWQAGNTRHRIPPT